MAFFQRTHKATMILQRSQLHLLLKIFYHLNSHLILLIITYQIQNILEIKVNNVKGIENIPLKDIVQGILTNLSLAATLPPVKLFSQQLYFELVPKDLQLSYFSHSYAIFSPQLRHFLLFSPQLHYKIA